MMDIMDVLRGEGGVVAIARKLGVDEGTAQSCIATLLPAVMGGGQNQLDTHPQRFGGLASILNGLGGGGILSQVPSPEPTDPSAGNNVLDEIFGSKDTSRVASDAAGKIGPSPDLLKKMLPLEAMLAVGYFAKRSGGDAASGSGLGGTLGSAFGGGTNDGGGNVINDVLGKLGR